MPSAALQTSVDNPIGTGIATCIVSQPPNAFVKRRSGTFVFRSPTFAFLGRRMEYYGLSDRQSTDASDRAVDSRGVLVHANDRLQHFWRRTR